MTTVLIHDGRFRCYRVEAEYGESRWHDAGCWCDFHRTIPAEVYRTPEGALAFPFSEFSDSGECWEDTGLHAVYDIDAASRMLVLLSRYNPGIRFRLVWHLVEQERTTLAEMTAFRKPSAENTAAGQPARTAGAVCPNCGHHPIQNYDRPNAVCPHCGSGLAVQAAP